MFRYDDILRDGLSRFYYICPQTLKASRIEILANWCPYLISNRFTQFDWRPAFLKLKTRLICLPMSYSSTTSVVICILISKTVETGILVAEVIWCYLVIFFFVVATVTSSLFFSSRCSSCLNRGNFFLSEIKIKANGSFS